MGAVTWLLSALAVFAIARIIPSGRRSDYLRELLVILMAGLVFGAPPMATVGLPPLFTL